MKKIYFADNLKHPRDDELDIVRRAKTAAEFDDFLRKTKIYKIDVFRRNVGLSYCLSNLWAVGIN